MYMKSQKFIIVQTSLSCCLIFVLPSVAFADVQPKDKDIVVENLPVIERVSAQNIADRLGLGNVFQSVFDFISGIKTTNDLILEAKTPDWDTVKGVLENVDTRGKELARQLENRDSDSFNISRDAAEQVQRSLIQDAVSTSTTSTKAIQTTAASLIELEDALIKSVDLAIESNATDVSQQILQNLSQQSGINTQVLGRISSQNVQAQKDRANQINLALQQARYLSKDSTRRRRESLSNSNLAINAWGAVGTPLFLYEQP